MRKRLAVMLGQDIFAIPDVRRIVVGDSVPVRGEVNLKDLERGIEALGEDKGGTDKTLATLSTLIRYFASFTPSVQSILIGLIKKFLRKINAQYAGSYEPIIRGLLE